jgi:No apical meristem-associated C-terminal domain
MTLSDGLSAYEEDGEERGVGVGGEEESEDEDEEEEEGEEKAADGTQEGDEDDSDPDMEALMEGNRKRKAGRPKGSKNKKGKKAKATSKPGAQKFRTKFTEEEDLLICKAWVNASQNPVLGNNQTGDDFWKTVLGGYNELLERLGTQPGPPPKVRKANSLLDRFQRHIQKAVNKFNACWIQRKRLNISGTTDNDIVNMALEDYKVQNEGHEFKWVHCLEVLRESPKFSVDNWEDDEDEEGTPRPASRASNPSSRPASRASASFPGIGDDNEIEDEETAGDTGRVNNVTVNLQGSKKQRPPGSKIMKVTLKQAERREYWNKKRDKRMEELAAATNRAAAVMEFSAIQMSVNARVSHYILLGQNRKALALMKKTESTLQIPQAMVTDNVGNEEDDDEEGEEDKSVHDVHIEDSRVLRQTNNGDDDSDDGDDDGNSDNETGQREAV